MLLPRDERSLRRHRSLAGAETAHGAGLRGFDLCAFLGRRGGGIPPDVLPDLYRPVYRLWHLASPGSLVCCPRTNGRHLCSPHEEQAGRAGIAVGPGGVLDPQRPLLGRSSPDTARLAGSAALRTTGGVECGGLRQGVGLPGRPERGGDLARSDATLPIPAVVAPEGTVVSVGWRAFSGGGCGAGDTDGSVPAALALDAGAGAGIR